MWKYRLRAERKIRVSVGWKEVVVSWEPRMCRLVSKGFAVGAGGEGVRWWR
jgi:hypothetical protein